MVYVYGIEPRLTPLRPASPDAPAQVLVEWAFDLEEELAARLELMSPDELHWQPHPDANSPGVTVWHVARWLDVLATVLLPDPPQREDLWHSRGWAERTGYEPRGVGFLGLGTLTGYSPEEMRAVPKLDADDLHAYLAQAVDALVDELRSTGDAVTEPRPALGASPFSLVGSTLQGSFGHVGEIDALVALRDRLPR